MPPPFLAPLLDRADLERLLRSGLSLRQAAGALRVHLEVALAAMERVERPSLPTVPVASPPHRLRRPVVRRGKAVEGAASGNGKARAIAAG
jgi:hypothetical protein